MAQHNELGKAGEIAAIEYLKAKAYRIRHVNWRWGPLELDIIAETSDELVFVEVKTRSGHWDSPEYAVNHAKIRHIISAADSYIKYFNVDLPARFDIISIIGNGQNYEIEHIEDAFYPPIHTYRR
ncbi:MAG: YraN family protein [Dysgonamonadaceae bacterium]|jgi:putative endonuclease|nr:YraN family protein [Dysgonamonadaceae bacterium]